MYCQHCGEEVDDDAQFCRHCGETLDTDQSGSTRSEDTGEEDNPATAAETNDAETEDGDTSGVKKGAYLLARLVQIVVAGVAVLLLIGGLNMNVLQFAALGIFSLVLLGIVGVVEFLVIRPISS
jgi:uncharacterized membrane protein YvbJ